MTNHYNLLGYIIIKSILIILFYCINLGDKKYIMSIWISSQYAKSCESEHWWIWIQIYIKLHLTYEYQDIYNPLISQHSFNHENYSMSSFCLFQKCSKSIYFSSYSFGMIDLDYNYIAWNNRYNNNFSSFQIEISPFLAIKNSTSHDTTEPPLFHNFQTGLILTKLPPLNYRGCFPDTNNRKIHQK